MIEHHTGGHINSIDFGEDVPSEQLPLVQMLKDIHAPLDSISLQIVAAEYYETTYRITDHKALRPREKPLALVSLTPKEDLLAFSRQAALLKRFSDARIYERFGLNIVEFLNLPREMVESIFTIMHADMRKETKVVEDIAREMDKG